MQIPGLKIEPHDGYLMVSRTEPPADTESDDVGELVFVADDDFLNYQANTEGRDR